ncbi:hypothetical protein [Polyangium mundeleinium]|uniref:Uncharacterized protein n=1 Tax=Polyangium mundeleinium TaxID=2995306 RepID=A0ABT5EQ07_9BACT|nr:hypothetical protein [Polyangium mundeleinium]MDC0743414.1 hypothetical protein [Polyangium mundeleinium]
MRVRASMLALSIALPAALFVSPHSPHTGPQEAAAAVSVVVSLDELVTGSSFVVVAKAAERQSMWEDTPNGRRIVTYTRLDVERSVVGESGTQVWVRTLGGVVGDVGQWVSGEAVIPPGERSLLFLHKTSTAVVVTAMAQGHYPVITTEGGVLKLAPSPDAGTMLPRTGPSIGAREVLVGATLSRALVAIEEVKRAPRERK